MSPHDECHRKRGGPTTATAVPVCTHVRSGWALNEDQTDD